MYCNRLSANAFDPIRLTLSGIIMSIMLVFLNASSPIETRVSVLSIISTLSKLTHPLNRYAGTYFAPAVTMVTSYNCVQFSKACSQILLKFPISRYLILGQSAKALLSTNISLLMIFGSTSVKLKPS